MTGRVRDERFERATLEQVASPVPNPVAGGAPFVAHAAARLALGERAYGDAWAQRSVPDLLNELLEEAADLGAWAVLVLQSLDALDADHRAIVEAAVLDAARAGARAHGVLVGALQAIDAVPPAGSGEVRA